jgi:hypothetical protein
MMKLGAIQSSFIPWRGYFDFIASVDQFVILDDVQYSKNTWRNRNRIKTQAGTQWLTVPVLHRTLHQLITDTQIDDAKPWQRKHLAAWQANYGKAPYLDRVFELLAPISKSDPQTLSELNINLIKNICRYLDIKTKIILSTEFPSEGKKTDRIMELITQTGASAYLSGPSADSYLDKDAFKRNGIRLEYKSYVYRPYKQLWGQFEGAVTILDMIAMCGPAAKEYLSNQEPDLVVVA